ncbi:YitT family protein [Lutibacter sp. B2]|nr:YitT family protein [Lutibacter sp. B2]
MVAISITCFIAPNNLLAGGVTGIALIIHYLTTLSVAPLILLLNIPIFIVGVKYTNKEFMTKTLIGMILLSLTIWLTEPLVNYINIYDLLANAIVAGILTGVGLGFVIRNGYSTGGFDIINIVAKKRLGINIAATNLITNGVIIIVGGMVNDFKLAVYTVITLAISSIVLDKVIVGFSQNNLVLIVSQNSSEIANEIMTNIGRGVTFLKGKGAYTKKDRNIIYCIVSNRQLIRLKDIVNDIDEKAFISISHTSEIHGQGFEKPVI